MELFCKPLAENETLKYLSFRDCPINDKTVKDHVLSAISKNTSLLRITVGNPQCSRFPMCHAVEVRNKFVRKMLYVQRYQKVMQSRVSIAHGVDRVLEVTDDFKFLLPSRSDHKGGQDLTGGSRDAPCVWQ